MIFDSDKKTYVESFTDRSVFYLHMYNFISSKTDKKNFHNGLKCVSLKINAS